mmetsp:Transcript_21666/g.45568  ORF Transcript_21666/g.45568 Transcript_21666/m.45568 type:complete len:88 (+) Transcript_21666:484-747(+)
MLILMETSSKNLLSIPFISAFSSSEIDWDETWELKDSFAGENSLPTTPSLTLCPLGILSNRCRRLFRGDSDATSEDERKHTHTATIV